MSIETANPLELQLTSPCWKTLPIELIVKILDDGAQASTQFCLKLSTISSWSRQLAAKQLYRTLVVSRSTFNSMMAADYQRRLQRKDDNGAPSTALKVVQLIRSCWFHDNEPADFVQTELGIVRTLQALVSSWAMAPEADFEPNCWVDLALADLHKRDDSSWENLRFTHLLKCDNLTHLSLRLMEFTALVVLAAAPSSRAARGLLVLNRDLQVTLQVPLHSDVTGLNELYNLITTCNDQVANSSLNPTVTHLTLLGYPVYTGTPLSISHFPRLSHLAIPFYGLPQQELPALEEWALEVPTLQVLVILVYEDLIPNDPVADLPQRRVVEDWVDSHKYHRVQVRIWPCDSRAVREDWEEVTRGAPSIWERALGRKG